MMMATNMPGFLLIDKPAGITSHDVVDRIRRITGIRTVGHGGTLDPFATGLLLVGVGREATKLLGEIVGVDKSYVGTLVFGATTDTQDGTGRMTPTVDWKVPTGAEVLAAVRKFVGPQKQIPPMYSAKKIGGQKLYDLARAGKTVERAPCDIVIHGIDPVTYVPPRFSFGVRCTAGTYIRTLAHDIGQVLGCGAYLESLRRTAIGYYSIRDAVKLDELAKTWEKHLIPPV